jgi:hypothetical protein
VSRVTPYVLVLMSRVTACQSADAANKSRLSRRMARRCAKQIALCHPLAHVWRCSNISRFVTLWLRSDVGIVYLSRFGCALQTVLQTVTVTHKGNVQNRSSSAGKAIYYLCLVSAVFGDRAICVQANMSLSMLRAAATAPRCVLTSSAFEKKAVTRLT